MEEISNQWLLYSQCKIHLNKGKKITANAENIFLETPALMVFFINRVSYRNGKLLKDCQPFDYDDSILVGKAFQS